VQQPKDTDPGAESGPRGAVEGSPPATGYCIGETPGDGYGDTVVTTPSVVLITLRLRSTMAIGGLWWGYSPPRRMLGHDDAAGKITKAALNERTPPFTPPLFETQSAQRLDLQAPAAMLQIF